MSDSRTYIITGAAGDIGATTARRFARQPGAKLALFDRRLDLLSKTEQSCRELGAEVISRAVDQTKPEVVEAEIADVVAAFGGIDVLFANAGYGKFAPLLSQPLDEWRRHIDVNLTGTFLVCKAVANAMVARELGGSIVVNCSSGATQYSDLLGAYCATKSALWMLVQGLASELGAHRIRVNAVLPGVIETGMTAPMLQGGSDHRAALSRKTPLGRIGAAEDVAAAVEYLSSADASYLTGIAIPIDGGQTLHGQPQWYATDYSKSHQDQWEPCE
jgi:NAD(P)-dependent dehydrogenase (short-subunit alcohol dehydrogenase family)